MASPVLQFKRGNAGVGGTVPALRPGEPALSLNNFDLFVGFDTSVAGNKFFGSHRYWGREDGTTSLRLKLVDKTGIGGTIQLKAPDSHTGLTTYTFPSIPVAGNFLKVDANGNLSWDSVTASATFSDSTLSGTTTITGILTNNASTTNSGITTFTNITDNTLGNSNTGAVQIDGGLGVDKNVTIGGNLNVQGQSEFVGVVTFRGGIINIGDGDGDTINVGGRFSSNLIPSQDNTYDVGISTLNWRNAHFSGIGTFETGAIIDGVQIGISGANVIDTVSGNLTLNSAGGTTIIDDAVTIQNNLVVNGNVTVGGTTVTLRGEDVFIENKDIVLGFTTSITPNDDTANHAGVAIASTVGTPLANFDASGINTLPSTYKQMMWFKSGTLGFSTDAFAFNYGVAIGTTTMANGVRLAVGSGITMSDNAITVTDLNTNSSTASLFNANATTVNAFQAATNIVIGADTGITTFRNSVRVSDSLYDSNNNAGVSGQFLTVTGAGVSWTTIAGVSAGAISTAARANSVDTVTASDTAAIHYLTFVNSHNGTATAETVYTDDGIYYNPGTNTFTTQHATFTGDVVVGTSLSSPTLRTNLIKSSDTNATAITIAGSNVTIGGDLIVQGNTTQLDTATLTVEDRTIELGRVPSGQPTTTTWDLAVLFNYGDGSAKKAGVVWEASTSTRRFQFTTDVNPGSDGGSTDTNLPQFTVTNFAPIEVSSLWINGCGSLGALEVIKCNTTEIVLQDITIDAGTF